MRWEDAFSKFGFDDGDGNIGTWEVTDLLIRSGYSLSVGKWGAHNILIYSLQKHGTEFMPPPLSELKTGYSNPRDYLPDEIIELLDKRFYIK